VCGSIIVDSAGDEEARYTMNTDPKDASNLNPGNIIIPVTIDDLS
jgi:hypothetical protein